MEPEFLNFAIGEKLAELNQKLRHYKDNYLPDIYSYTGSTQAQHAEKAAQALDAFKSNIAAYRHTGNTDFLGFTRHELANYLRSFAIEQYETAQDWNGINIYIVLPALRKAVKALNELKKLVPELNIYSHRYLVSRTKIQVQA